MDVLKYLLNTALWKAKILHLKCLRINVEYLIDVFPKVHCQVTFCHFCSIDFLFNFYLLHFLRGRFLQCCCVFIFYFSCGILGLFQISCAFQAFGLQKYLNIHFSPLCFSLLFYSHLKFPKHLKHDWQRIIMLNLPAFLCHICRGRKFWRRFISCLLWEGSWVYFFMSHCFHH